MARLLYTWCCLSYCHNGPLHQGCTDRGTLATSAVAVRELNVVIVACFNVIFCQLCFPKVFQVLRCPFRPCLSHGLSEPGCSSTSTLPAQPWISTAHFQRNHDSQIPAQSAQSERTGNKTCMLFLHTHRFSHSMRFSLCRVFP